MMVLPQPLCCHGRAADKSRGRPSAGSAIEEVFSRSLPSWPWRSPAWRWRASPILPAEEAARIKFEATADDALNRIESRIDLHLSLLRATHAPVRGRAGKISRRRVQGVFRRARHRRRITQACVAWASSAWRRPARRRCSSDEIRATSWRQRPIYPGPTAMMANADRAVRAAGPDQSQPASATTCSPTRRAATRSRRRWRPASRARAGACCLASRQVLHRHFPGFLIFYSLDSSRRRPARCVRSATAVSSMRRSATQDLFKAALDKFPLLPVHAEVYRRRRGRRTIYCSSRNGPPSDVLRRRISRHAPDASSPDGHGPSVPADSAISRDLPRARSRCMLGLFGLLLAGAIALAARYQERAYDAVVAAA